MLRKNGIDKVKNTVHTRSLLSLAQFHWLLSLEIGFGTGLHSTFAPIPCFSHLDIFCTDTLRSWTCVLPNMSGKEGSGVTGEM